MRWLDSVTDYGMNLNKLRGSLACYSPWSCKEQDTTGTRDIKCRSLCDAGHAGGKTSALTVHRWHTGTQCGSQTDSASGADWTHLKGPLSVSQVLCFLSRKPRSLQMEAVSRLPLLSSSPTGEECGSGEKA